MLPLRSPVQMGKFMIQSRRRRSKMPLRLRNGIRSGSGRPKNKPQCKTAMGVERASLRVSLAAMPRSRPRRSHRGRRRWGRGTTEVIIIMAHQPMTCIPISVQDRLAKLEQQLRDDHERKIEQRLNGGRYGPPPPPPGKIGILATDL